MSEPPKDVEVIDLTLSDASESEDEEELEEQLQQRSDSPGGDSDASEIEITLDQTTRSQLQNAIANVSETRLRDIISRLVQTELALEICLTRELVTIKRGSQEVVQRWEVCRHCDDEYDINTAREDDECIFHPGQIEHDEDLFPDWDEPAHGPMDTPENRLQMPERFIWTCCDKELNQPGCVHGEHKAVVTRKRKRLD